MTKIRRMRKTLNLVRMICKTCLSRPEELTVSQWAEKYRVLDSSSAFPGRWSNSVTPYLIGIMDEYNNPYTREIAFCKPTQVGGSEVLINILCYLIMSDQSPTMIVLPIDELAMTFSDRIQRAIDNIPVLKELFNKRLSRKLEKKFKGMILYISSSQSVAKLASKACKNLFFDETDKHKGATKKEASSYKLARERTKTYPFNYKIFDNCTPTIESGHIWQAMESSDVIKHFFVPCPHCDEMIELKFAQIHYSKEDGLTNAERAEQAMYYCQACGCAIEDIHKPAMLRKGKWREVKRNIGKKQIPKKVAFWLNTLYSPFVTWENIAKEFLDSKDDPEELQNFINSWLAEPWKDTKLSTDSDLVLERQTDILAFELPEWTELITGGVDVQEQVIYWTIRAWGKHITSQNIAHGKCLSLSELPDIMNMQFKLPNGQPALVNLCCIDSGDQTDDIYDFCAMNSDWAIPVKGSSNPLLGSYKISTINKEDSKAYGTRLIIVDTDKYKDSIAAKMQKPNGKGSWMVHKDCDIDYASQVTAEQKVMIKTNTGQKEKWVPKKTHIDNHYLDTEVYCFVAADLLGVRQLHINNEPPKKENVDTSDEANNWIQHNESWV